MKYFLIAGIFNLFVSNSSGQYSWFLSFDDQYNLENVFTDTIASPNCLWQIGSPQKTFFDSARSSPNVIVTDTINPVPPNDLSVFYLNHWRDNTAPYHVFVLHFWYKMDGDSTDFGNIDVSRDDGQTWINLLHDDVFYQMTWLSPKPTLKGSTIDWQPFDLDMEIWASAPGFSDKILVRFIYATDSNSTPHDGWMIDDIYLEDWWEDIPEIRNDNLVSIFPNPASEYLNIHFPKSTSACSINIYNQLGQLQFKNENFNRNTIDLANFSNGIYSLKYSDNKFYSVKNFIVSH